MNKNTTNMSLSSYFNDLIVGFYEDTRLVESFGRTFGFDINKDYFLALSFLYPSNESINYEEKRTLRKSLISLLQYTPINQGITGDQIVLVDKGVMIFLIAHTKEELLAVLPTIKTAGLELIEHLASPKFIRIGIGTIETGIEGIKTSSTNAIQAVNAGETFKKERKILDYMGMEIYNAINTMVVNYGDALTRTILKQLTPMEQRILSKYYKCKENIANTASDLDVHENEVRSALERIKLHTGLDVNDTEDNFKLHFIMIAKKVLDTMSFR